MGRGFLSGIIKGAVVSAIGLAAASQLGGRVEMPALPPEADSVQVPADSEFARARSEAEAVVPEPEAQPAREPAPVVVAPETGAPPAPDTRPAAAPETGEVDAAGLAAPEPAPGPEIAPAAEDPVEPRPAVVAPTAPEADAAPAPAAEPDTAEAPAAAGDAGAEPGAPAEEPVQEAGPPAAPAEPEPEQEPAPPSPEPAVELVDSVEGIRLPVPEIDEVSPGPGPGPDAAAPVANGPAIQVHAEEFEWDGSAPLIALLLFDQGAARMDPERLRGFPVPVTVAVNALAPDAGEAARAYRAAGAEVALLTPLPEGATPADVEVAFQSYLEAVSVAVAVLDTPEARFQENRPRAAQIAEILASTGHGMITYERGLNSALQLAAQEGVPAAAVLRAFDDGERDVAAMKRFLDQAAFQAGVDGTAIVTGLAREEVLTAISEWVLGTRAASVTLAPVSGVLNTQP